MKRVRSFWDLDETLLDTTAMLRPIIEDLAAAVGCSPNHVRQDIAELDKSGFTWERLFAVIALPRSRFAEKSAMCAAQYDRAGSYLFPGALEAVASLDPIAEQILVTFGDPTFQRRKWAAIPSLHPHFHSAHFVDGETVGKGALIASYDATGVRTIFVDDSRRWLDDCARHAPHVLRVRMRYAPGEPLEDDGIPANETVAHAHDQIVSLIRHLAG